MLGYTCAVLVAALLVWAGSVQTADTALQTLGFSCCQHRLARASQLAVTHVRSRLQCARDCAKMAACQVAQTRGDKSGGLVECRLLTNVTSSSDCSKWTEEVGTKSLLKKHSICGIAGVNVSGSCGCLPFTYGSSCESILDDCVDKAGFSKGWGWIKPSTFSQPIRARCDFGWNAITVLQRSRHAQGPRVFFNRSWEEYVRGFGDEDNFWWGLENIYKMTKHRSLKFQTYMEYSGGPASGAYRYSALGNASTGYRLDFSYFEPWGPEVNPGIISRRPFCTYDRDCNDCSKQHQGAGWWYGPNCETGGATYPQSDIWWTLSNGTTIYPSYYSFSLGKA